MFRLDRNPCMSYVGMSACVYVYQYTTTITMSRQSILSYVKAYMYMCVRVYMRYVRRVCK